MFVWALVLICCWIVVGVVLGLRLFSFFVFVFLFDFFVAQSFATFGGFKALSPPYCYYF